MRKDERLNEILRHASKVFYEKGFDRASIREIAKQAGMSLAGLYYYFSSKEELLFMIQEEIFSELLKQVREELETVSDPVERLRAFIRNHLAYFVENLLEMKVLSHEFGRLQGEHYKTIARLRREYYEVVEGLVEEILSSRGLPEVERRTAALSLFGMMNWIYTWYREDKDGDAADVAARMSRLFLHGLLNG